MDADFCGECRFPDEILAQIFSFCSVGTLYNVMLTCRRFRDCANINSVWKAKLKQLIELKPLKSQSKPVRCGDTNGLNEFDNCKEIYRRFSLVFDSKFRFDNEFLKCTKCFGMFCHVDCIQDRDELITFDFGSKTTWFKYTGEMTGQLSMHPTIGPIVTPGDDTWSPWSASAIDSMALAYEQCPVCARMKILRSSGNHAATESAVDRKVGQSVGQPNRLSKALSKLSSFRGLQCFSVSESGDEDDLVLLPDSEVRGTVTTASSSCKRGSSREVVGCSPQSKVFTMYQFLLQHLLSRNSFYHLHNIPFVICEPVGCDPEMKQKFVKLILCQLKAPGVCFVPKAVAIALYSGLETCLVVDSGAANTVVTPVVDSLALTGCVRHLKIGGSHLTHQLLSCLSTKGIDVEVNEINIDTSHVKRECYLPYDTQLESRRRIVSRDINIKGTKDDKPKYFDVKLSHELYQLAEDMYLHLRLPELILQSVESLDGALRKRLLSNIILTGGNCRLSGLAHRLTHDLQRLTSFDPTHCVRVIDPRLMTGRSDAVIGASYVKKWHHVNWISREDFVLYGEKAIGDDRCAQSTCVGGPMSDRFDSATNIVSCSGVNLCDSSREFQSFV